MCAAVAEEAIEPALIVAARFMSNYGTVIHITYYVAE